MTVLFWSAVCAAVASMVLSNLMSATSKCSMSASSLRSKYLTTSATSSALASRRTAVVVGSTSGIGQACAHRLAEQGFTVLAVGRDRPGRAEKVVAALTAKSEYSLEASSESEDSRPSPKHEFYPCDAFSLASVASTARSILSAHPSIDAIVLSQGMATVQSFTPTVDGNDEKLTLHYWSRMAFTTMLLPALRKSTMPGGGVVLSVLSAGVHSPYKSYKTDPELKENYSIANAANFAGYYNDLGLDYLARQRSNEGINFVHAAPGFVNTNWGTEFPWYMRGVVRTLQPLGRSPSTCAEYMLGPTVFACSEEKDGTMGLTRPGGADVGVFIMDSNGREGTLTSMHTDEARTFVWDVTVDVLKRAGIDATTA